MLSRFLTGLFKRNRKLDYLREIESFCDRFNTTLKQAETRLRKRVGENCLYFTSKDLKGQQLEALYFSVISIVSEDIKNILEIGTGIGTIAEMLSRLFPEAHIYTLDLPKAHIQFEKLAQRKNREKMFQRNINEENIIFLESDSFLLPLLNIPDQFDLTWVDGGHSYPAVAWDIMYAYNHIKRGGYIFMHDYNRQNTNVKQVVDYIREIINEEIHYLPFAGYDREAKTCWLRKE